MIHQILLMVITEDERKVHAKVKFKEYKHLFFSSHRMIIDFNSFIVISLIKEEKISC